MSVVLAVKEGNKVWMAADCQASRGASKLTLVSPNSMKIWRMNGHKNMLMGGAGAARDINIMSTMDTLYDPILDKAGEEVNFKFVVRNVVPEIFNELSAFGRTTQGESGIMMNSTFLLAKDDTCYQIDHDGYVSELVFDGEAMAIGSGADVALAAYNVLADLEEITIKEKLIRAVSQACHDDLYVNYPIIIMETTGNDVEVFDGMELYSINELTQAVEELEEDLTKEEDAE